MISDPRGCADVVFVVVQNSLEKFSGLAPPARASSAPLLIEGRRRRPRAT